MSTESASGPSTCHRILRQVDHCVLRLDGPTRRRSSFLSSRPYQAYPSPPMSNPPSPPRPPPGDIPVTFTAVHPTLSTSTATALESSHMSGAAVAPASLGPPFYEAIRERSSINAPSSSARPLTPIASTHAAQSHSTIHHGAPPTTSASSDRRPSSSKGGRKSKAHVASACINCKRAHLSCDVNRPCARCVASGKQDTCFDVQHKKRGRPRLREEGEFKVEQMLPESVPSAAMSASTSDSSTRQTASMRHRRQESFRSLRSQGSDGSGVASSPTYPYPPPPTATQPTFGYQYPPTPQPTSSAGYEVPTAYLDLDLVVLRANQPCRQILMAGQDIVGRQLSDIAAPADGESFQNIRNRLRAERDRRDPAYMPPINLPGQDPLQGAVEADVERYAQGFDDNTFTWSQTQLGPAAQSFPARVRLAKANTYFVAVTLPSFRPMEQPPQAPPPIFTRIPQPLAPGIQTQTPESYAPPTARSAGSQAIPSAYASYPGAVVPSQPAPHALGRPSSSQTYPPVQQRLPPPRDQTPTYPSYQPAPIGTPRLPIAEPPTETTAFTPRSSARELPPVRTPERAGVQLPPIVNSPALGSGIATSAAPEPRAPPPQPQAEPEGGELDEEGRAISSRKRQRMGIDDVLHPSQP